MKVWITKYALSDGVFTEEGTPCPSNASIISARRPGRYSEFFSDEGKEWHRTEEAAYARAEAMRVAKILSLEKQIAKLAKFKFAVNAIDRGG